MSDMKQAALNYAKMGWRVFPCKPNEKTPLTRHGVNDATTDVVQIINWWTRYPNANIAVACGNGMHVIDVDVTEKADGWEIINKLRSDGKLLPVTPCQNTPSGGAHFFYKSDNPPVNKNSFMPGIDIRSEGYYVVLPPSNHPNGGKYKWADNLAPWQCPLAEYPNFMRPEIRKPEPCKQPAMPVVAAPNDEINQRAALYLAECEPAVQGLGGHDKLLWAASAMVNGLGCSDGQAFELLSQYYNPLCSPPWDLNDPKDYKDFTRKITEARKNPPRDKPMGWLLTDPTYAPVDDAILPGLPAAIDNLVLRYTKCTEAASNPEVKSPPVPAPLVKHDSELNFLCQPTGLLGEICSWINSTCLREQPFLTLACSLSFCGALFGQKVKDVRDSRTNLYCMAIASSSGGKNHAPKQISKLCTCAGYEHLLGATDSASDSAMEKTLSERGAILYLWDEIGHMITSMKHGSGGHKAGIITLLMKLYSAAGSTYTSKEYATQESTAISQPCCCLYGMSTPERFADGIDPMELIDGWMSRCLVFVPEIEIPDRVYNDANIPPSESILQQVIAWRDFVITPQNIKEFSAHYVGGAAGFRPADPLQIEIPTDDDAEQLLRVFECGADKNKQDDPAMGCLWRKAGENARKIALITAASDSIDRPRITLANADYATRLISYLLNMFEEKILPLITNSKHEKDTAKIMSVISSGGIHGITKGQIVLKVKRIARRDREAILTDLIESGEVFEIIEKGVSKPTRRYWTTENYNKRMQQIARGEL